MIHKTEIEHYDLKELATVVGDLRYDALAEFLELLSQKITVDGNKDASRGRTQLATSLTRCSEKLSASSQDIEKAWKICEPYMS